MQNTSIKDLFNSLDKNVDLRDRSVRIQLENSLRMINYQTHDYFYILEEICIIKHNGQTIDVGKEILKTKMSASFLVACFLQINDKFSLDPIHIYYQLDSIRNFYFHLIYYYQLQWSIETYRQLRIQLLQLYYQNKYYIFIFHHLQYFNIKLFNDIITKE
jgi:hypothetical protein